MSHLVRNISRNISLGIRYSNIMLISIVHFIYSERRKKPIPRGTPLLHRTPQSSPVKKNKASKAGDDVIIIGDSKPTQKAKPDVEITKSFEPTSRESSRGIQVFEDQLTMRKEWIPHRKYHPEWLIQPEDHRPTNCPT